jgi:hypothetical protein
MDRIFAGKCLPSANGDIDEAWFDFERKGASAHTLRSQDRGSGATERVNHNVSPPRAVSHCVRDEVTGLTVG